MFLIISLFFLLFILLYHYSKKIEHFRYNREFRVMPSRSLVAYIHKYGKDIMQDNQLTYDQKIHKLAKQYHEDLILNRIQNLYNYDGYNAYKIWK